MWSLRTVNVNGTVLSNSSVSFHSGGLGEAVLSAVAEEKNITVKKLAVKEVPRSGPPAVLLEKYGISAKHIVNAVQQLVI